MSIENRSIPGTIFVEGKTLYPRRIYQKNEYNQLTYTQKGELLQARKGIQSSNHNIDSRMGMRSIKTTGRGILNSESTHLDSTYDNDSQSVAAQFKKRRTSQY